MKELISVILFFTLTACPPAPPPVPPGPDGDAVSPTHDAMTVDVGPMPVVDASTPKPAVDACGAGEAKLLALGCKDARGRLIGGPNLHDAGWATNCRIDAEAGVDLHAICIAAAADCAAVMACK